jgi:hypothetical protein
LCVADNRESKAERKASEEEMMARMEAKMDNNKEKMKYAINSLRSALGWAIKTRVEMKACRELTHACLEEEKEPTPEETEAVEKPQEVPEGATDEETSGCTEDRTGEQRLAVRRHKQRKKRTQVNGGPR